MPTGLFTAGCCQCRKLYWMTLDPCLWQKYDAEGVQSVSTPRCSSDDKEKSSKGKIAKAGYH